MRGAARAMRPGGTATGMLRTVALLLLLVGHAAFGSAPARVIESTWLTGERVSGSQTARYASDGTVTIEFEYQDRGRGPDYTATLKLGPSGAPRRFAASGLNNTRASIDEQFVLEDGRARWYSAVERGSRDDAGDAFYFPYNAPPELTAVLVRALRAAKDKTLPLLPSGRASLEEGVATTVERGDETLALTLYAVSGLDAEPRHVWLDGDGELFSLTWKHFALARTGWEHTRATLATLERDAAARQLEALAARLARPLPDLTAIRCARIFDSVTGKLTEPATVFLWRGTISAVYFTEIDLPAGAEVIDGTGRTLMPALWDMHNHVQTGYFLNYLACGVTNVRDMGNDPARLEGLMAQIAAGRLAAPDVHPLGFIDRRGPFAGPVGRLASDLPEAMDSVSFYAQRGYRGIKLYSSIAPDWVAPLAAEAHARGLLVAGHVPAFMTAEQAIDAGFDELTHLNMLLLNFMGAETLDTRGPGRFLVPGERSAALDLDAPEFRAFVALMRERGIAQDTTLAVLLELFRNEPGAISPIFAEVADRLPSYARREVMMATGYNQGREEAFARSSQTLLDVTLRLHEAGVRLLPGTDNLLPGFTLLRELVEYTEAGIPAA